MVMPGSVVTGGDNKKLYNGNSEWQNDYTIMPDYYQTYYRNYDDELGRFIGTDPDPESAESMTNYQYAGNNPIMLNDPIGGSNSPVGNMSSIEWTKSTQANPQWWNPSYNPSSFGEGGAFNQVIQQFNNDNSYDEAYDAAFSGIGSSPYLTSIYHAGNGTPDDPSTGMSITQFAPES